jgi:hypothetical protein
LSHRSCWIDRQAINYRIEQIVSMMFEVFKVVFVRSDRSSANDSPYIPSTHHPRRIETENRRHFVECERMQNGHKYFGRHQTLNEWGTLG